MSTVWYVIKTCDGATYIHLTPEARAAQALELQQEGRAIKAQYIVNAGKMQHAGGKPPKRAPLYTYKPLVRL